MTDFILSGEEVQRMISSRIRVSKDMADLIVSHRLLQERVEELELEIRLRD